MGLSGLGQAATIQQMIVNAANLYGVPASVALAVAQHESQFQPGATHINTNGTTDYGVFQLNSSVLQTFGLTPAQAFDPQTNIDTAVSLLGSYIKTYGDVNTALWAYASGPGTVAAGGAPNSTAVGLQNYVAGYTLPAGIDLSTAPVDTSGLVAIDTSVPVDTSSTVDPVLLIGGALLAGLLLYQLA